MGLERKHINIAGTGYEGIMLFLAEILCCAGKKVLISDCTVEHSMEGYFPCVKGLDPKNTVVDYGGIGYTVMNPKENNIQSLEDVGKDYDIVFKLKYLRELTNNTELNIFILDERAGIINELQNVKPGTQSILIINDYTGAVKRRIENTAEKLDISKVYILPPYVRDRKLEILAGYNDRFKFKGLSREKKEMLMELTGLLCPGLIKKEIIKAYKQASEGGRK
ncbi:MAG: hypothetical protein IKS98_07955 [Lachnospiraceae bacterium]|nr:hypothetical protein [Lachnospiraceae bacterium]